MKKLFLLLLIFILIGCKKVKNETWNWSGNSYYLTTSYSDNTQKQEEYCRVSNDTLLVLKPYNGTLIKQYSNVRYVYKEDDTLVRDLGVYIIVTNTILD